MLGLHEMVGGSSAAFTPQFRVCPGVVYSIRTKNESIVVAARGGRIEICEDSAERVDFSLVARAQTWRDLFTENPQPGRQNLLYFITAGEVSVEGDLTKFYRSLPAVRETIEFFRHNGHEHASCCDSTEKSRLNTAVGSYIRVGTSSGAFDVYVERAGTGRPVIGLSTAGSDTTQWHGIITETDFTDNYELVTIDLPWHGRSRPAQGQSVGSYRLTPETYSEFVIAATQALNLTDSPVLVGASMAGAAVVRTIAVAPELFAAGVSCQAAVDVAGRLDNVLLSNEIDQKLLVPEWTYGLMNPASPTRHREAVWWGYAQGGPGIYTADITSYQEWDFFEIAHLLTRDSPHIAFLSGAYDTSVPSERTEELANLVPNSSFTLMPDLGHFPFAENPPLFVDYLYQALVSGTGKLR
jgi:pimeloyl-ACP methyl ester carboxylesterase